MVFSRSSKGYVQIFMTNTMLQIIKLFGYMNENTMKNKRI